MTDSVQLLSWNTGSITKEPEVNKIQNNLITPSKKVLYGKKNNQLYGV